MIIEITNQKQNTHYLFRGDHKIPQPDKEISRRETNLSHQQHANLLKILSNKIQQGIQITIYHGQVEFTPGIHVDLM